MNRFLNFANSLPLGSWHCCGCEKNSFRIKRPDPEVTTDVTSTTMNDIVAWPDRNDPTQRFGLLFRRKKATRVLDPSLDSASDGESSFEHVGNVTRSDDSLLVRKARAARYSQKFREGVIERILSGKSTITQVKDELKLSERDLLDWINDRVMKQDQHIAKLTQVVDAVQQLTEDSSDANRETLQLKLHLEENIDTGRSADSVHSEVTIEGRVNQG
ncbi:hypothetical protein [Mariniblastus fucicola]|nr:hypothetical protein [Mariniblastus fucicola]